MNSETVQNFIEKHLGKQVDNIVQLPQSGSARQNYIVTLGQEKYVITYNPNLLENEAFYYFSDLFAKLSLNTPKIHKISEDRTLYIQDFLGEKTLSEIISKDGLTESTKSLVKQTLQKLYTLQNSTNQKVDYSKTFEYEAYDDLPITHDLYYFKNFMVDVLELEYHKSTLLKEFKNITNLMIDLQPKGLMIRDFQSRNIMVDENQHVQFIDYQSAMEGPLMYDVVSFLFQAKANFPESFKTEMIDFYINLWKDETTKEALRHSLPYLKLIRFMQVLGAYGFRGLIQRKEHFVQSISLGIKNLNDFMASWEYSHNYPELNTIVKKLSNDDTQLKIQELVKNK